MLKAIIYGETGVGCSTLANTIENSIVFKIGDNINTLQELSVAIRELENSDSEYVIIDDMTHLDNLINAYTAGKNGKNHIEEFPYNGGYKLAVAIWETILKQLDKTNKNIIFVAHAILDKVDSPILGSYSRYDLSVNPYAKQTVKVWANEIWFYQNNLITSRFFDMEGHLLHSNNNMAFFAKTKNEPQVLNTESLIKNNEALNNYFNAFRKEER